MRKKEAQSNSTYRMLGSIALIVGVFAIIGLLGYNAGITGATVNKWNNMNWGQCDGDGWGCDDSWNDDSDDSNSECLSSCGSEPKHYGKFWKHLKWKKWNNCVTNCARKCKPKNSYKTIHLKANKSCLTACGNTPKPKYGAEWIEWQKCRVDCDPKIDLLHKEIIALQQGGSGGVSFSCEDSDGGLYEDVAGQVSLYINGNLVSLTKDHCKIAPGEVPTIVEEAYCLEGKLMISEVQCPFECSEFVGGGGFCSGQGEEPGCCVYDTECTYQTQAECASPDFFPGLTCDDPSITSMYPQCEGAQLEGCCYFDQENCMDGYFQEMCDAELGTYYGDGTVCSNYPECGASVGGCCYLGPENCMDGYFQEMCDAELGTYYGDGTICLDYPECEGVGVNGCCEADEGCFDVTSEQECQDSYTNGFFHDGLACANVCLGTQTGACFIQGQGCVDGLSFDDCHLSDGDYQSGTCADFEYAWTCCQVENGDCVEWHTLITCARVGGDEVYDPSNDGSCTNPMTQTYCAEENCCGFSDGTTVSCSPGFNGAQCEYQGGLFSFYTPTFSDCSLQQICTTNDPGCCQVPDGTCSDGVTPADCLAQGAPYHQYVPGSCADQLNYGCDAGCCFIGGSCNDGNYNYLECISQGGTFFGYDMCSAYGACQ